MAVCVHCSAHTSSLFVSYGPTHLLCTRCPTCGQYADPYVEHEAVIVAIDLILVKPRAYRHVLFNRPHLRLPRRPDEASGPSNQKRRRSSQSERRASLSPNSSEGGDGPPSSLTLIASREEWMAWWNLAKRFAAILLIDAYLRWFYLCADSLENNNGGLRSTLSAGAQTLSVEASALHSYLRVLRATFLQSIALHLTTLVLSILYHRAFHLFQPRSTPDPDLDRFRAHLVPASLLLSNVTPTLLLSLLLLWQPRPKSIADAAPSPQWATLRGLQWDESSLDWAIRSLVGGLSAGVGLGG